MSQHIKEFRDFLRDLRQVRELRLQRKNKISFKVRMRHFRDKLRKRVESHWPGGYILLECGDYLYVPGKIDLHGVWRLIEPFIPDPTIAKFCKPGGIVIDVGANIGDWSLPMAKAVGTEGKLFAFEPLPFMREALEKTLKINRLTQASVFDFALSNQTGRTQFAIHQHGDQIVDSGKSRLGALSGNSVHIEVNAITLDRFISQQKPARIDFIKVDVEGHECQVLEGGRETLEKFQPALIIEAGNESVDERRKIKSLLSGLNYEIIGIAIDNGVVEVDWEQYVGMQNPFEENGIFNILLLPAGKQA
jgi:FkbM family methyltransferase